MLTQYQQLLNLALHNNNSFGLRRCRASAAELGVMLIRLPGDIEARLAELAARTGRTKTFYAREAILEHLDQMEDKYLTINRLENSGKRWTLDELEQELDLDR